MTKQPKNYHPTVVREIRMKRAGAGLNQSEAAKQIGIGGSTLAKIEADGIIKQGSMKKVLRWLGKGVRNEPAKPTEASQPLA